jgi:hypothetical protein
VSDFSRTWEHSYWFHGATFFCRLPNSRHSNEDITYLLNYPNVTETNLIHVGYHLAPARGCHARSDEVDIFNHFVDILTVGNLDVDYLIDFVVQDNRNGQQQWVFKVLRSFAKVQFVEIQIDDIKI